MQIDSTRPLHRLVPLTKNQFAIIDEEDDPWIGQYKWFCSAYGYAVRGADKGGRRTILYMHRVILGTSPGIQVDHINGNRLDNRRCNLREVTSAQNKYNMRRRGGSSRYKGVAWSPPHQKWVANIMKDYKGYHLGLFADEVQAARAYDAAAQQFFGSYARLNFPETVTPPVPVSIGEDA